MAIKRFLLSLVFILAMAVNAFAAQELDADSDDKIDDALLPIGTSVQGYNANTAIGPGTSTAGGLAVWQTTDGKTLAEVTSLNLDYISNQIPIYGVYTGTHTGSNDAAILTDSAANGGVGFTVDAFNTVGTVYNVTDGSSADITDNDGTTVTGTLTGGTGNDWDTSDAYIIVASGVTFNLSDLTAHRVIKARNIATQTLVADGDVDASGHIINLTGANGETLANGTDTQWIFTGDESLIVDLDTATDNEIAISSGTGATQLNFGTLNMLTTGAIHGGIEIIADDTSLSAAQCYGSINNANGTETITLPPAVVGMNVMIYSNDATVKTLDPDGTEEIFLNGATNGAGNSINSPGAVGDFITLVCFATGDWYTLGQSGVWIDTP